MSDPQYAFFKGNIVPMSEAKVSVMNHALNYGTAVFGGIRAYWNADESELYIFRASDHYERIKHSADLMLMDLPYSVEEFTNIMIALLKRENFRQDVYIRPLIYKSYEGIGVKLHGLPNDLTIWATPLEHYLNNEDAVKACFSSWRRIDDNMIPSRGKISGAYANSALAKGEALMNGFDEAIVLNEDGHIAEGSAANFGMVRHGKVITPPLTANILEGITLKTVITLLTEQMGIEVVERNIDRTEVYSADEAFFCGTGVQISPIVSVDHRPVGAGSMGPVVKELRRLFFDVVRGKNPQYRHWLQPVYAAESVTI